MLTLAQHVFKQAAKNEDLSIIDNDRGLDDALVGDQVGGALGGLCDIRNLLRNFEQHRIAFVDLRRDRELDANALALNGLERVDGPDIAAGVRE